MRKGFTMLEILIVLAVMSLLIGMGIFGMNILQRNVRNNRRIEVLSDVRTGITNFKLKNGTFPDATDMIITPGANIIYICYTGTTGRRCNSRTEYYQIDLNESYLYPSATTNNTGTAYCYEPHNDGYSLAFAREGSTNNASYEQMGEGGYECSLARTREDI